VTGVYGSGTTHIVLSFDTRSLRVDVQSDQVLQKLPIVLRLSGIVLMQNKSTLTVNASTPCPRSMIVLIIVFAWIIFPRPAVRSSSLLHISTAHKARLLLLTFQLQKRQKVGYKGAVPICIARDNPPDVQFQDANPKARRPGHQRVTSFVSLLQLTSAEILLNNSNTFNGFKSCCIFSRPAARF
jgi:hypothetical protein